MKLILFLVILGLVHGRPQNDLEPTQKQVPQQDLERQPRARAQEVSRQIVNKVVKPLKKADVKRRGKAIGIVRSVYNAPIDSGAFDFSYETQNGIKTETVGSMKKIGDADVVVMRGSYEYVGSDGQTYVVDWVADENGFQPSAPHLPKPVEIPFPEQKVAVEAQLRFAREQRERKAKSVAVPAKIIKKYY